MLAAQVQSKAIGEHSYEVLPLPAGMSLKVLARVLKMVGPAFSDVASLSEAASAVGTVLAGGLAELDEETVAFVCSELAKVTTVVDGDKKLQLSRVFDEHFRGRIVDLFAWLRFAAEVTYGPLGAALVAMKPETPPPAPAAAG